MPHFSPQCTLCPRLAGFLKKVKKEHPDYFSKPVPAYGDANAKLCIVGLAPGMHGANATGRPFTGDHAGVLLYQTLYKFGFANQPFSEAGDKLKLPNCRITNAVKCLPPQNKPIGKEVNTCNQWLQQELEALPDGYVIVALGGVAHKAVIKALGLRQADFPFGHAAEFELPRGRLLDSYHCSRYNTQTKRLTTEMFEDVFATAAKLLSER